MKDDRLAISLDYLKFTIEADGETLTEDLEDKFKDILEGDEKADRFIADFIRNEGLESADLAGLDEMSRYPGTRCIVNYFGIKDRPRLKAIDKLISSFRTAELLASPPDMPIGFDYLKAIHSQLFGDIYPSAGMVRNRDENKRSEYCKSIYIDKMASDIFDKLRNSKFLRSIDDVDEFINELAYFMGEMEALHPFLDGNGRTTRYFFTDLARKAGYDIVWSATDPDRYLEGNIAALDGDYQPLIDVLEEAVIPIVD